MDPAKRTGMPPNIVPITALAATISRLFGIKPPKLAQSRALDLVMNEASASLRGEPVDRCLIFTPDALGMHLWPRCKHEFAKVRRICPLEIKVRSVVPPVTPVCFASMFTGAEPADHGIQRYERPVLRCDTLFDVLIRAGRKPAIVTVKNSSMDLIFKEREMVYFSEKYDPEVILKTLELLHKDVVDVVVCYQREYDDMLHKTHPSSTDALHAVSNHIRSFQELAKSARESWNRHNYVVVFAPDHGAHTDPVSGKGTHGEDIGDDMELLHWYGIVPRRNGMA